MREIADRVFVGRRGEIHAQRIVFRHRVNRRDKKIARITFFAVAAHISQNQRRAVHGRQRLRRIAIAVQHRVNRLQVATIVGAVIEVVIGLGEREIKRLCTETTRRRERVPRRPPERAQLGCQPVLEFADAGRVDFAQPASTGVVQRCSPDFLEQLFDHGADAHHLGRLLHKVGYRTLFVPVHRHPGVGDDLNVVVVGVRRHPLSNPSYSGCYGAHHRRPGGGDPRHS